MKINSKIFQRLWRNQKVLFILFQEKLRKLKHVKPRNHLAGIGKLLKGVTDDW